jgi:poly(3-hydroxybutyrate) depolymerase
MKNKLYHSVKWWATVASLSLATGIVAQSNVTLTMQVDSKARHTVFHVPSGIDKPAVVFFIHGANGSGPNFKNESRGDAAADKEKFIAVYPSASSNGGTGTWDDMRGTGNFPFFFAILDTLDVRYKIDRTRIYMTGFSQGGFISFAAGCFYADKFAAIAPASGHTMESCTLKRPVPVFLTFGANEDKVAFQADIDKWVKWNNCPTTFKTQTPFPATNSNSKATLNTYGPCDKGSVVLMNSIAGQGHQWPATNNMVLADEAWAFFKGYSLEASTPIKPLAEKNAAGNRGIGYVSGNLRVNGVTSSARLDITDISGRVVASEWLKGNGGSNILVLEFTGHPRGIYQARVRESGKIWSQTFVVP